MKRVQGSGFRRQHFNLQFAICILQFAILLGVLAWPKIAGAVTTYSWTGTTSLSTSTNWSPYGNPGSTDIITFSSPTITGGSVSCSSGTLSAGTITTGTFTLYGSFTNNGTISGGTWNVGSGAGAVNIGASKTISGGLYNVPIFSLGKSTSGTYNAAYVCTASGVTNGIQGGTYNAPVTITSSNAPISSATGTPIFNATVVIQSAAWQGSLLYSPSSSSVAPASMVLSTTSNLGVAGTLGSDWTVSSGSQVISPYVAGGVGGTSYTGTATAGSSGMTVTLSSGTLNGAALSLTGSQSALLTLTGGTNSTASWAGTLCSSGATTLAGSQFISTAPSLTFGNTAITPSSNGYDVSQLLPENILNGIFYGPLLSGSGNYFPPNRNEVLRLADGGTGYGSAQILHGNLALSSTANTIYGTGSYGISGTGSVPQYVVPVAGAIIKTGSASYGAPGAKFDGAYWKINSQGDVRRGVQFDISGGSTGIYVRPPGPGP